MELFQVRYFLALARSLNFTRAAEACNVSQPALTRAIQRLEEELGGPLLHRERSLTQLTALGRAMLPHLEAAQAAAETAVVQAVAFRRRECEPLRLGIDQSLSAEIVAPALGELQARMQGFECGLAQGASADLMGRIMEGEVDSAVLIEPATSPERLNRWRLFRDRYVVLCPENHRLASLAEIPITALAQECLVARGDKASDFDQALVRLCAAAGITPRPRHHCASEEQIGQMIAAGLGIALAGEHRALCPGTVARPLADSLARRDIMLTAVAGRPQSPALAAFLKLMRARDWQATADQLSKP
jgi:DNA-binding transcriptional LysR family regulator